MLNVASLAAAVVLFMLPASASALPERSQDPHHPDWPETNISADARRERAARIRDAAALVGMTNGALLGGIAQNETGLAHCWSEATWACQGPPSSSCANGPVIAGASDGPCAAQQGGLGMFQFDAGTFTDTINTYGPDIVTIEGNVEAVVPFLVTRAIQSIAGVDDEQGALDWMNSIPIVAGDPLFEEWIYFVAWRYNGCMGCTTTQNHYRDGTLLMLDEMGADFWNVSGEDLCEPISGAGRIIEENDNCAQKRGPARYWRSEAVGHGGALRWTKATDSAEVSNYAIWRLRFESAGDYEVFVYSDGGEYGQSTQAEYQVTHAAGIDRVRVNQSSANDWLSLGVFTFGTEEGQQVRLDDNTGEPWAADPGGIKILFDALRVDPIELGADGADAGPIDITEEPDGDEPDTGKITASFCSLAPQGPTGAWPLLLVLFLLSRRSKNNSRCRKDATHRSSAPRGYLAALAVLGLAACATAAPPTEAQGADAAATASLPDAATPDSFADAAPVCDPCDRLAQCGCPSGACDLDLDNQSTGGVTCREIEVPGNRDSACSSLLECDAGFICLGGQCRSYCDEEHPCVDGACLVQPVYNAGNDSYLPIPGYAACSKECLPDRATSNGCPADPQFGCHLVEYDPTPGSDGDEFYYSDCKPAPATGGGENADCSAQGDLDCQAGYECVSISGSLVCKQLCLPPNGACSTGTCRSFLTPITIGTVEYGVCLQP